MTDTTPGAQTKELRWFHSGEAVLGRLYGIPPGLYVCPLCVHGFTLEHLRAKVLTKEHVPARSIKGKEMVLTCWECNNASGRTLEDQLARSERMRAALSDLSKPVNVTLTYRGIPNRGQVHITDNTFHVHGIESRNDPADLDAIKEALTEMGDGEELTLSFGPGFDMRAALLSYVRSAYLAAFARFGYAYAISHPSLAPIRAAISGNDDGSLVLPILIRRGANPMDRQMFVAAGASSLTGSFVVVMGECAVFLPSFGLGACDPLPVFAARPDEQLHIKVGHVLGWPTRPLHELDHRLLTDSL